MSPKFHITMFPWLAMGHLTPFLHLSNGLAQRGHTISFLLPNNAIPLLQPLNLHPHLITFIPLSLPSVPGLPPSAQTASDIPFSLQPLLASAMDLTRPQIQHLLLHLRPDFVFYDFTPWIPDVASSLGIKSVSYRVVSPAQSALSLVAACPDLKRPPTPEELAAVPDGSLSPAAALRKSELHHLAIYTQEFGSGITFFERINSSLKSVDAIAMRTCREIGGEFCDYIGSKFKKPVLLTGPVLPDMTTTTKMDERWATWLGSQKPGTVVYCAFGSQSGLEKEQFKEILLGMEMAGYPFFAALKPPGGCETVEEAMPEGFEERVRGKGVVYGGWVQQNLFLKHPSVGCFVSHGGFGSMWESLLSAPQIVLIPELLDHILNTRYMAGDLKVAVEVDKDESGWVSREGLCRAVKEAMDGESEVGCLIRENHSKLRGLLGGEGFMNAYIDTFLCQLEKLLD